MSKNPFDYLVDDDNDAFFQKIACSSAEAAYGIEPPRPLPRLEKRAAPVPETAFEKIASRLGQDLGILKTAGSCGTDFGMCKRANVYLDQVYADAGLSIEEALQVFDKVAAEAIDTDLNAAWCQLSPEYPDDMKPWLEQELAKIGFDLVAAADMEKKAVWGLLARGAIGRAGAKGAVKDLGRRISKGVRSNIKKTKDSFRGIKGHVQAQGGAARQATARAALPKIKVKGQAGRMAKLEAGKQIRLGRQAQVKGLQAKRSAGGKLTAQESNILAKQERMAANRARQKAAPTKAPTTAPTTAPPAPQPTTPGAKTIQMTPAQQGEMKAVATQQEAAKAQAAAAKAAKNPGPPPAQPARDQGPPPAQPAPNRAPDATPDAPKEPKGLMDHWKELTPGQKAGLGVGAYMAHDTLKN